MQTVLGFDAVGLPASAEAKEQTPMSGSPTRKTRNRTITLTFNNADSDHFIVKLKMLKANQIRRFMDSGDNSEEALKELVVSIKCNGEDVAVDELYVDEAVQIVTQYTEALGKVLGKVPIPDMKEDIKPLRGTP